MSRVQQLASRKAAVRQQGSRAGGLLGYEQGYRYGRCEAFRKQTPPVAPAWYDLKVLYIPQGFPAIDNGVIAALRRTVRETVVGTSDAMLALAEQHRPDLLLVLNGLHVFPADHLRQVGRIRELGIRTVIWFADDPYFTDDTAAIAPHYDAVATHEQSCVPFYLSLGCSQVLYVPLAVDTDVFRPVPVGSGYHADICFIGMAFWNRVRFFDQIAGYLSGKKVIVGGGLWERMRLYRLLKRSVRDGWIPIEETVRYYNGAKIVINLHRGCHRHGRDHRNLRGLPGQSINPRTYEIAACGTMQLTDVRDDLTRYYTPGVELDIYRSAGELIDKLDYYLKHDAERQKIALNGLRRTMQEHSFVTRIGQLLGLLGY
ncbi:glycosyltransferase [Paenibacillus sp. MZ04-78.2]|uniref:CgeB family protein n=1 Tax=Paenibacillus sp. MZ04-78.2 TaxID=2962034 RepID=UPI0020B64299|nr:glycosyltransferase [Paenibacillus sp. MZ04-78.2]MCP3773557.1 glycosyltransferase [Paenibacillus sp. MZ04-78.2]